VLPDAPDDDMLQALSVAEQFADGAATKRDLARARAALKTRHAARVARWKPLYTDHVRSVPAWHATREAVARAASEGAGCCAWSSTRKRFLGKSVAMEYPKVELAAQASLLRDIFGPLPVRSVTLHLSIKARKDSGIIKLATDIYDHRSLPDGVLDGKRLKSLADALDEAGCQGPDLLGHLRQNSPHVRGCWAMDLILGKS
jgi:hypothetical protein